MPPGCSSRMKLSRLHNIRDPMPAHDLLTPFALIRDPTPSQLETVFELRVQAWRGQARFKEDIQAASDRWDKVSSHRLLADDEGRIAGAFRFSLHRDLDDLPDGGVWVTEFHESPGPHGYSSRMFVHPDLQGRGLSERLEALSISEPLDAGAASVTCLAGSVPASVRRMGQMERRGWSRIGVASRHSPDTFWVAEYLPTIMCATRAVA